MKKELFVILLIALSGITFSVETAVNIVPTRYNPYPAEPGHYLDLWIQIENRGNIDASDFAFVLEPEYPFSLYEDENDTRTIGTLRRFEPVVVKYKLYVDENAVEGWNDLKYKYKIGNMWIEKTTSIYVSHKPQVEIVSIHPSNIGIGKKTDVSLIIKNVGRAEARNLRVKFDTSSSNLKIIGTDTRYLESLDVGNEVNVSFEVLADTENSGVELVPVLVTYEDTNGTQSSYTYYVGLDVSGEPEIKVLLRSATPEPFRYGSSDLEIEVINIGPVTAKFVSVNASTPSGVITREEYYIGDLDSDDFDIIDFNIKFNDIMGRQPLYVTVKYKTPEYDSREVTRVIYFNVSEKSQETSKGYLWLLGVVVVAIVFILWKRRK